MERVALLIPAIEYSVERPLLHLAGEVFARHGWTVQAFRWSSAPPRRDGQDFAGWFGRLRTFVHEEMASAPPADALVGKSMACFAAGARDLPGIWLTPPLRDSLLADDLRRATKPFLLVGSRADPSWEPYPAEHLYEAPDADHSMEVPGDPLRSAAIRRDVTAAMDAFVGNLQ